MDQELKCPDCGSPNVRKHGKKQIHCRACGKYPVVLKGGKRWADKYEGGQTEVVNPGEGSQYIVGDVPRHMSDEDLLDYLGIDKDKWIITKVKYTRQPIYRKDRKGEWASEDGVVSGWSKDSGKMVVEHMYGVQVWLSRKSEEIKTTLAADAIIERIEKASPKVPRFKYKKSKDDLLLQIMMPDIHFGRVTRASQSGENFNMKIAFAVVRNALETMLEKASKYKVGRILLPFGNDSFNVDNEKNTTAAGTPQQEENYFAETFIAGEALFNFMMSRMLEVAPVDVLFLPGNHDPHRLFYFGRVAEAVYKNNKNVSITNSPKTRQYYNFGRNVFGFTHGNNSGGGLVKLNKLPSTMMFELRTQHPDWINQSNVYEWHLGHIHHKQEMTFEVLDDIGVTIRFFRSLTSADAWHFDNQFVGTPKAAEAILWSRNDGLYAQLPATVERKYYQ